MSNRFVSGGTMGSGGSATRDEAEGDAVAAKTNPEWEAVQQELEAERKRRDEARLKAAAGGEQSLYDILQANKAAKQAAFEEKHKLKNQFRALDDDEADFLDEVRERTRRDEERVRRETEEGLRAFRQRQSGGGEAGGPPARRPEGTGEEEAEGEAREVEAREVEGWGVGRKRKRSARERDIKGLRRKVGSVGRGDAAGPRETTAQHGGDKKGLPALVDYGSDEAD